MVAMTFDLSEEEIKLAKELARLFKQAGPRIVEAALDHWPADSTDPNTSLLRGAAQLYIESCA